ncbi:hypothetical protein [Pseudomonas lundensis]|uniref:hypothetical protein n=1 Tax=Pseudomonas lundensis TaxID=86185 RepID=UPI0034A0BA02
MHYNRYRYYHPRAGRFVSKAPINDENSTPPHSTLYQARLASLMCLNPRSSSR